MKISVVKINKINKKLLWTIDQLIKINGKWMNLRITEGRELFFCLNIVHVSENNYNRYNKN